MNGLGPDPSALALQQQLLSIRNQQRSLGVEPPRLDNAKIETEYARQQGSQQTTDPLELQQQLLSIRNTQRALGVEPPRLDNAMIESEYARQQGSPQMANWQFGQAWTGVLGGDSGAPPQPASYEQAFGNQAFVGNLGKTPAGEQLLWQTVDGLTHNYATDDPKMAAQASGLIRNLRGSALKQDTSEGDVRQLQRFLIGNGYDLGETAADGKFGKLTHQALQDFLGRPPQPGQFRPMPFQPAPVNTYVA